MFLTVHSSVGLVVSRGVTNPLWAFFIGFIFHYIFDIIPHGDTKVSAKFYQIKYIITAGIIDLSVLSILLISLIIIRAKTFTLVEISAILGSVIPDVMQLFYFIFPKNKLLGKIQMLHTYPHNLISKRFDFPIVWGLLMQIFTLIILIAIYI
ncbi:MAG: hypothetical protein NTZ49_05290 [Candidatus Parcubacteria bacterium]|nr:hypothetical protein [Candidatus Parcubacteria bacterium]